MPVAERCLYYVLHDLYDKHRHGLMSAVECRDKKNVAVEQYRVDRKEYDDLKKQIRNHAKLWQGIEKYGVEYAKSSTRTEAGDALYYAVYGLKPKDNITTAPIDDAPKYRVCGKKTCDTFLTDKNGQHRCAMIDQVVQEGDKCYYAKSKAERDE